MENNAFYLSTFMILAVKKMLAGFWGSISDSLAARRQTIIQYSMDKDDVRKYSFN
jgi:hypothetical protein